MNVKLKPFNVSYPLASGLDEEKCYPFDLKCLKSSTWESNPDILFIIGFVDKGDVTNGQLLTASPSKELFNTLIEESAEYYERVTGKDARSINYSVINFNYHRNMHLKGVQRDVSESATTRRAKKLIDKLKPKTVVCFGKSASVSLLGDANKGAYFGIPQELDTGKHKCNFISVPSYHRCIVSVGEDATDDEYDEAITNANTIGYISRCLATMFDGSMPLRAEVDPSNYTMIETLEDFDLLIKKLLKRTKPFSLDLETNSLDNYDLFISTVQIGLSEKSCSIIVLDHEDSPFDKEERKYIKKKLKKFFSIKEPNTFIIGQNLAYDFRVLRQVLKIPVINWMAWDCMAGEHALDENLRDLDSALENETPRKSKNYALHKICLRYGMSWYTTATFSKSERHLIYCNPITSEVCEYMAMDVLAPLAIYRLQHLRARATPHKCRSGNYLDIFHNYVLYVLGNCTTHVISTMEHRGIQLSREMFKMLQGDQSTLKAKIKSLEQEFYDLPEVVKANRLLLDKLGAPRNGLFGELNDWVFNISTEAHIQTLFLDQLGIEDYEERKDGRGAKVGKAFQNNHKDEYKEVELYGEFRKHKAILSTYIVGWQKQLDKDTDAVLDFRIRPGYSFLLVTGRSNSFGPNLQNVPEHHSSAKFVKYTMKVPRGYLKMDADYSSHEVRCWALASNDKNLVATFRTAQEIIYTLRMKQDVPSYLKFKYESDTHKINYSGFTGVPVKEVNKEQRQSAKGIVFGSMYGIGDPALASSINKSLKETKEIKGKFFKRFSGGKRWMDDQRESVVENNYVVSMLGRRRNLIGYKVESQSLQAAFERRAQNSPIQGVASDFGFIASRLYTQAIRDFCEQQGVPSNKQYFTEKGWEEDLTIFDKNLAFDPIGVDCMVHDCIKSQVRYDLIYVAIHLKEWAMVTGVREYVKEHLGINFQVDLGVEIDVGATGATMNTWNWVTKDLKVSEVINDEKEEYVIKGLSTLVKETLMEQNEDGYDLDVKLLLNEAKSVYENSKDFLFTKYPLAYQTFKDTGRL